MQNFNAVLDGTTDYTGNMRGLVLLIQTATQGGGLTVMFLRGGAVVDTVGNIGPGTKLIPVGGFDAFVIRGAAGAVVGVVTMGDIDIQLAQTAVTVQNTNGNPVPVAIVSEPGAPFQVSAPVGQEVNVKVQGTVAVTGATLTATNVGINNTAANPVPVMLHASDDATAIPVTGTVSTLDTKAQTPATVAPVAVAVSTTGAVLLAADATRRAVRFYNAGANPVAITPDNATTFAQAAIVLNPGDFWNETDAPGAAWWASTGAAGSATVNLQTVKA
jgi:hypothetical protein